MTQRIRTGNKPSKLKVPLALPLGDAQDAQSVGEKAFRLAEMRRIGLPVPDAMVITNSAFQLMLSSGILGPAIEAKLSVLTADTPQVMADVAHDIATLVTNCDIPEELIESLMKLVAPLLAQGPVAVRSSACGEDSSTAAFAGQLDSFLGIRTRDEVLLAIKRCWASYWSHRSLAYQRARHVRLRGMGVIVQSQVDAKFAGVLFTRDVQNAQSQQMVAEYCEGLADGLVTGSITPRRFVIPWDRRADETSNDHATADSARLSAKSVANLAELGQTVESIFGCPQDIEWAVDQEDHLHIVQSRPITAFVANSDKVIWSNANVNENFPEPICPLLYSIASLGYYHYFRNLGIAFGIHMDRIAEMEYPLRNIIGVHGGRMYYNLTNIHAVLRAAPWGEFLAESFNQFVGANATTATTKARRQGRLLQWWETLQIMRRAWGCFRTMEQRIARFETTINAFAEDCHPERLPEKSWTDLLPLWRRFLEIRAQWTDASLADAASMISYGLTQRFLAREFTGEEDQAIANRLLTGLCDIVSGLPTERLWELSRLVRRHPELQELLARQEPNDVWLEIQTNEGYCEVRSAIHTFLEEWGFRCSGELMLTTPSYQENPAKLLEILRAFAAQTGESPNELLSRQREHRQVETQRVLAALSKRQLKWYLPFPRKSFIANRLIGWTQRSVGFRERARLKQALLYSRYRRLALTVGREFVSRKLLVAAEDVFFLTHGEIESLLVGSSMFPLETASLAKLRRDAHEPFADLAPPGRLSLAPGESWYDTSFNSGDDVASNGEASNRGLRGQGVCGGCIVGRAVVLTDPNQFEQVSEGDILVTRQTDPGWGPILFLVRGLVMERGGMLSHGAILAREFGIPSVVDVQCATKQIVTGNVIRVDGDRGIVEILD